MKQAIQLVITVNLVAAAISLIMIFAGFNANLDPEHVTQLGGSMTMLLLLFAIAAHLKARLGQLAPSLVALIAVPGPVYAWMAGPWNHILGYHAFTFGIHAFILYNLSRLKHGDNPSGPQGETK